MITLLISIHPRHAKNIFDGKKTIELRKQQPRPIDRLLVYETLPKAAIIGWVRVSDLLCFEADKWATMQAELQLSAEEIKNYLGQRKGYGIVLEQPQIVEPIPLSRMRQAYILPPQGYRYLYPHDIERLGGIDGL